MKPEKRQFYLFTLIDSIDREGKPTTMSIVDDASGLGLNYAWRFTKDATNLGLVTRLGGSVRGNILLTERGKIALAVWRGKQFHQRRERVNDKAKSHGLGVRSNDANGGR